jgi:hypothetical protein
LRGQRRRDDDRGRGVVLGFVEIVPRAGPAGARGSRGARRSDAVHGRLTPLNLVLYCDACSPQLLAAKPKPRRSAA